MMAAWYLVGSKSVCDGCLIPDQVSVIVVPIADETDSLAYLDPATVLFPSPLIHDQLF